MIYPVGLLSPFENLRQGFPLELGKNSSILTKLSRHLLKTNGCKTPFPFQVLYHVVADILIAKDKQLHYLLFLVYQVFLIPVGKLSMTLPHLMRRRCPIPGMLCPGWIGLYHQSVHK